MSVDGSQVRKPHILKKHPRYKELLDAAFCLSQITYDLFSASWNLPESFLNISFETVVNVRRADTVQISGHPSDILRYGHPVVV